MAWKDEPVPVGSIWHLKGPAPSWLIWCMVMLIEPSAPRAGRAAEAAADMAAGTLITPAAELQRQRIAEQRRDARLAARSGVGPEDGRVGLSAATSRRAL